MNPTLFGRAMSRLGAAISKQTPLKQAIKAKYGEFVVEGTAAAKIYREERAIGLSVGALTSLTVAACAKITSKESPVSDEELLSVINDANSPM